MAKIEITRNKGIFLINGKKYEYCSEIEKSFFDHYLKSAKQPVLNISSPRPYSGVFRL